MEQKQGGIITKYKFDAQGNEEISTITFSKLEISSKSVDFNEATSKKGHDMRGVPKHILPLPLPPPPLFVRKSSIS